MPYVERDGNNDIIKQFGVQQYAGQEFVAADALEMLILAKVNELNDAYATARKADISFTTAGAVTKTFQVREEDIEDLMEALLAFSDTGVVPVGFYWVSTDNTEVPFTYADLQGLARAIGDRGWSDFANLRTKKAAARAASTKTALNAVVW